MNEELRVAKATAKAEKARAKALRPWYRKKRWILSGAMVAVVAVGMATSGAGNHSTSATAAANGNATTNTNAVNDTSEVKTLSLNTTHRPQDDVAIQSCSIDEIGLAHAALAITNHSSGRSDYIISVAFEDGGVQIGSGDAFVDNVDGGQRAVTTADGVANGTPSRMTCSIKSVDRTASL